MSFFIRKGGAKNSLAGNKRKLKDDVKKGKKFKGNKFDDEEIDSEGSDIEARDDVGYESEEDLETAEEKKLRLAKLYLQEIEKELIDREEAGDEKEEEGDLREGIEQRLREDVEADRGKLRREITATLHLESADSSFLQDKLHKQSITCVCLSADGTTLYTASKDKGLVKWELPGGKKLLKVPGGKRGEENSTKGHCHAITCVAVSSDNKFLATGDTNKSIYIWSCDTMDRVHAFRGHKLDISGLVFRRGTHTLYSSSFDRSVKIWSVDEKSYVETLCGHQDRVMAIDAASRERCVTAGGRDRTVRVWKIVEESQLVFNSPTPSIDLVKLVNEEHWVSAGADGHLAVWGVMRKKPLAWVDKCHGVDPANGEPFWVCSLATLFNSDMVVTGSRDGYIRIWSIGEAFKSISPVGTVQLGGFVNSLIVADEGKTIIAGTGQEHTLGRWWRHSAAKNRIHIFKFQKKS